MPAKAADRIKAMRERAAALAPQLSPAQAEETPGLTPDTAITAVSAHFGAALDSLVRNLFRPSYGGNRNFALIYTLGQIVISADDDMRPDSIIEDSPESLAAHEVSRLAHEVARFAPNHVAQGHVTFALSGPVPDQVTLGQILD